MNSFTRTQQLKSIFGLKAYAALVNRTSVGFHYFNIIVLMSMLWLLGTQNIHAQTLTTNNFGPASYCPGTEISVSWTATGTFNTGNIFRVQLSNANGVFPNNNSSNIIGSVTSTDLTGTIIAMIPQNQASDPAYRVRVVSTNPVLNVTSPYDDNAHNLMVFARVITPTYPFSATPLKRYNVGDAISVPFTTNCDFITGNNFILEMSDKNGSFTASGYPKVLQTLTNLTSGSTFNTTIPSVPYGSGYRLRIRSTNPAMTSVLSATFAINPTIESTPCVCNNDQTPDNNDGTYSVTLIIRNADGSDIGPGQIFRVTNADTDGLLNTSNGPIGNPTFLYCDGFGCPSDVNGGDYYLRVHVKNNATYKVGVDGSDPDFDPDFFLTQTTCGSNLLYPDLPEFPGALMDKICLQQDITTISNPSSGVFSITNIIEDMLPSGFSQQVDVTTIGGKQIHTGGSLIIANEDVNEADNDPYFELYLIKEANNGCRVSRYKEFNVYKRVFPDLDTIPLFCLPPRPNDSINLEIMLAPNNTGGGTFSIPSVNIVNNKIPVENGFCYQVTYTIVDSCGISHSDTRPIQVTVSPKAAFNIDAGQPASPVCATGVTSLNVTRTSNGQNPNFFVTSNRVGYTALVNQTGNTAQITFPQLQEGDNVIYKICLSESNSSPASCWGIKTPTEPCADTLCRTFVVYRDRYGCGADNEFADMCTYDRFDVCNVSQKPTLDFGCSFFKITGPNVLTSEIELDNGVVGCKDEEISGNFNVSLFGLNANTIGGGKKLESFPGLNVVCSIFNFKIFGWRPLGALYNLLGCNKTIAQFVIGLISQIAGGDGGGYIVMADTDGNGSFDYLVEKGFFPSGESNFTIPNRVKGVGVIAVRAVGGWVNSPSDVCGDMGVSGVNLLDLLPIGAIPIVGAVVEDILAAAGCNVNIAFSVSETVYINVLNNEPATFINCNESGYVFAQTLDCDIPVNWSIPGAVDACSAEGLAYKGYQENISTDPSLYAGTVLPPSVVDITEPGVYQIAGPLPGSILPPGEYPVKYKAISCNGIPSICEFLVTVTSGNPILECPNDITVSADAGLCTSNVNGLAPYQGLGCASIINYSLTNPISGTVVSTNSTTIGTHNIPDGHTFELGTTVITYTMQVDINGDGDYDDEGETQICDFSITVTDDQDPFAVCLDVELHLDNTGNGTVYANELPSVIYLDGGSFDNCGTDGLLIEISKDRVNYFPSLDFDCMDKGQQIINLRATDASGNSGYCKAVVKVLDYFEGYRLDLDVPEACFGPFQDTIDFSPYIVIAQPDGTNIPHSNVGTLGPEIEGRFGISGFLPDPGSSADPGTITEDGVYTLGTGTGWVTISYVLSIEGQVNQLNDTTALKGCFRMAHDVFRVQKLDPTWTGGYMCCDQLPVWLGGANWDGTGDPPIPDGMLSLRDIRGEYPVDVYGQWVGQGVSFVDPDGINYSGDEFFMFDPSGLDGNYSLTYSIEDEPCEFRYTQEILVTCQDLHISISDYTVCPANWVDEKQVLVNLDDMDLVVSTTGFDEIGIDGGHYADGTPVHDLDSVIVVDGRVVIPGFYAPAVRSKPYQICVTTFQVTPFGCADVFCYTITVEDLIAPEFLNCPRDPIVADAIADGCFAFVNFALPLVTDNCSENVKLERVDSTGLDSGDLFPVGTTILAYTATDTVGNQSYCELKIIVNDYFNHTLPEIACPSSVTKANDFDKCGAIVNGIAPISYNDNCPDNITILYESIDQDGNVIGCGFEDASGSFFPVGTSTVTYKIEDQPLLLITEIVQDGIVTGMEVTNFGPADMDVTCASFILKDENGNELESYMVPTANNKSTYGTTPIYPPDPIIWDTPNPNVIPVGGTITHDFTTQLSVGQEAKYCFTFLDRVIDEITINDQVSGAVILRKNVCDHNLQTDFIPATPCDPGSYGLLNPGLPTMTPNGTVRGLQNFPPATNQCSFTITINDLQAPTCIKHDSISVANTMVPIFIDENQCMIGTITMPAGRVHDVNIHNLQVSIADAGTVTAYLNSPSGTRIRLFDNVCSGQPNIDVNLDETIVWTPAPSVLNAPCGPLGQGGTYRPVESFKAFCGEPAGGEWTLQIFTDNNVSGTLTNWDLQILYQLPYDQSDVVLENVPGQCDTTFTWIHPILEDNCCEGTVDVTYTFSNTITNESSVITQVIKNETGSTNIQGLKETKIFKVGTTVIEYTLIDKYGNISVCGFTVTVNDTELPEFVLPGCPNQVINLDPKECYGVLPYVPDATDNCGMDSVTFWYDDGTQADISHLPIGSYNITVKAEDIYGNINTCTFLVTVVEFIPDNNALTCNNLVNLSLGSDCEVVLVPEMILEGNNYRCLENYCIEITNAAGYPHANLFTQIDEGQTFTVSIVDCNNPNVANSCWGYVKIEHKLAPKLVCPPNVTVSCNIDILARDADGDLLTGEAYLDSCDPTAQIDFQDEWIHESQCGDPRGIIKRVWRAIDDDGRQGQCEQIITIEPLGLDDVVFPGDYDFDNPIECSDVADNILTIHPDNTGWPTLNGTPVNQTGSLCLVSLVYTDEIYDICDGSYEILRYWKVRNMCLPVTSDNPRQHVQVIKVLDTNGPEIIDCPVDITVSVDATECRANIELPVPSDVREVCSGGITFTQLIYGGGRLYSTIDGFGNTHVYATDLTIGTHTIKYMYVDNCGNKSICTFNVNVVDLAPPIAIVKRDIVVGLTQDYDEEGNPWGNARVFVESVDNGSFDNCGPIRLEIRRPEGSPSCGNIGFDGWNNNETFSNYPANFIGNDENDTDNGRYVVFCCEDLTTSGADFDGDGVNDIGYHNVIVRVWDDGNRNGIIGDSLDNWNETWAIIQVDAKVPPTIVCPPDATVYCDWSIDVNESAGFISVDGHNFEKTGLPSITNVCNSLIAEWKDDLDLDVCGIGVIYRTFSASVLVNGQQVTRTCTQTIQVLPSLTSQDWDIVTPNNWDDPVSVGCDGPTQSDIKSYGIFGSKGLVSLAGPCDAIGENTQISRFDFESGACRKWVVDYRYINWCNNEVKGSYYKTFMYFDTEAPQIVDCNAFDEIPLINIDCATELEFTNKATDNGGCDDNGWLKWEIYIDLWADGTNDYLFSSFVPKSAPYTTTGATQVINGDTVLVLYVDPTVSDSEVKVKIPEIINGGWSKHKVSWKVTDGCHNWDSCIEEYEVIDRKPPTPYCLSLSTAVMSPENQMVEVWSSDFDLGAYDNCTPSEYLYFTFDGIQPRIQDTIIQNQIVNKSVSHYFGENNQVYLLSNTVAQNEYQQGLLQKWIPEKRSAGKIWTTCGDFDVQVNVWDEKGNTDYCITGLRVIGCPGEIIVSGRVATPLGDYLESAVVSFDGNIVETPRAFETHEDGYFVFNAQESKDYTMSATYDGDYLDGVNTLDLVHIQRHILAISRFTDPYKIVAADANNDGRVSVADLSELRKLILGISDRIENASWRLPIEQQTLSLDGIFPYVENYLYNDISQSQLDQNFVAVKIGDVDYSLELGSRSSETELREAPAPLAFGIEDYIFGKDDIINVPIYATDNSIVSGFQMTMNTGNLQFIGVEPGLFDINRSDIGVFDDGKITMSYAGTTDMETDSKVLLFTLRFLATQNGELSKTLSVNPNGITKSEFYNNEFRTGDVVLDFLEAEVDKTRLDQNQPNPFKTYTSINFFVPENCDVTITLNDGTGRQIRKYDIAAVRGFNILNISRDDLDTASGIIYYTLNCKGYSETRKMILIQ